MIYELYNEDDNIVRRFKKEDRAVKEFIKHITDYRQILTKTDEEYGTCEMLMDNKDLIDLTGELI